MGTLTGLTPTLHVQANAHAGPIKVTRHYHLRGGLRPQR